MLNCIKTGFQLTNKYIILATPLILFSLLSSLYVLFSFRGELINVILSLVLFVLMLGAFLSGWAYMLKKCVLKQNDDDPNLLIKEFPSGVGDYFLPVLGLICNIFLLSALFLLGAYLVGTKFIGDVGISAQALSKAFDSMEALKLFMMSLSKEQIIKLNAWNFLILITMSVEYFLLMFQLPTLVFKCANPFKAFFISLKDLFSKMFLKNVLLYFLLFISYSVLSILTTIFVVNVVMHFIFTLINFYYLVFIAVLVFNYYYENFIKIGGKFDETI